MSFVVDKVLAGLMKNIPFHAQVCWLIHGKTYQLSTSYTSLVRTLVRINPKSPLRLTSFQYSKNRPQLLPTNTTNLHAGARLSRIPMDACGVIGKAKMLNKASQRF